MSIFNKKRMRQWLSVMKTVKEGRIAIWAKLVLHLPKMRVDKPTWVKRIRVCGRCPIYHPHKKTCGHDLEISSVGCGCYMPFKAASTNATCWARDNDLIINEKQLGWGDDVNDISDMKSTRTCHTAKPVYMRGREG